jgi:AcrR family transcriptional regulator
MSDAKERAPRRKSPSRADKAAETHAAIVRAALAEFTERGFAGARLDEISKRAGVAKGTIYIHFKDKEALFEGIVRQMILPYSEQMEAKAKDHPPQSPEQFLEEFLIPLVRSLQADHRVDILRLLISEGPRFPALAEIYYRVIVEPNMAKLRAVLAASVKPEARELANFPQIVVAPLLMGLIWNLVFERFQPVEVESMMRTHFRLMSVWMNQSGPSEPA